MGVVAASLAVMAAAESRPGFSVGALRRDGIVIPFATYDKSHWETNWPAPKLDLIVPGQHAFHGSGQAPLGSP